jgi:hypothetical protein
MFRSAREAVKFKYNQFVTRVVGPDPTHFIRYGAKSPLWTVITKSLPIPIFIFSLAWINVSSYSQWSRRDEAMDALDDNRLRFYGQSGFEPSANRGMEGVYMPTQGYVTIDGVTGINRGMDGRYQSPPMHDLAEKLAHVPITPAMLERARELHDQSRQDHERTKLG